MVRGEGAHVILPTQNLGVCVFVVVQLMAEQEDAPSGRGGGRLQLKQ